ncbi:MAG: glycosyltransferase, partial [Planctomyces sp.]
MKSSDWAEISVFLGALYLGLLNLKCWLSLRVVLKDRRSSKAGIHEAGSADRGSRSNDTFPSVTVAVPILSGDPLLSEKLCSTARTIAAIDATICVIWLVDESDLTGQQIVLELKQLFSIGRMVVCPDAPSDVNPKSYKLQIALDAATSEFFVVIDDDTTIDAPAILQAIRAMKHCDLYTGLPCYQSDGRFWSRLLATFVNNNAAITYLPLLNFFPPISINGMFYIVRTERWRDSGGYTSLLQELCDDYAVRRHAAGFHW